MGIEVLKIPNNGLIFQKGSEYLKLMGWNSRECNLEHFLACSCFKTRVFKVSRGPHLAFIGQLFVSPRIQDSGCSAPAHVRGRDTSGG